MLCLRLLSLQNALRRAALQNGCEIMSGVSCEEVYPVVGDDGAKRSALRLTYEEEGTQKVVTADLVVGADGIKSVVRGLIGGRRCDEGRVVTL